MVGERDFCVMESVTGPAEGKGGEVMGLTGVPQSLAIYYCAGLRPSVGGGSGPLGLSYLSPDTRSLCLLHTSSVGSKELLCGVRFSKTALSGLKWLMLGGRPVMLCRTSVYACRPASFAFRLLPHPSRLAVMSLFDMLQAPPLRARKRKFPIKIRTSTDCVIFIGNFRTFILSCSSNLSKRGL